MYGSRVYTNKGKCMSEYTMGEYMSEVHYTTFSRLRVEVYRSEVHDTTLLSTEGGKVLL